MIVAQASVRKPWIAKPSISTAVSQSISIPTTNQIAPSVMNASGSVSARRIGLRIVFRIPNSSAAQISAPALSAVTPLRTAVTIASTTAFATQERVSCLARRIICESSRWDDNRARPTRQAGADPNRRFSLFAANYPFLDVMWTMLVFFGWVIWFWLLITIFGDLFRRDDLSGWSKALWSIFVIVTPFLGVFVYMIANSQGMAERNQKAVQAAQTQTDEYIRTVAAADDPAAQIANA